MDGKKGRITSPKGNCNTYTLSYRKLFKVWKYHETPTAKHARAVVRQPTAELEWIRIQMITIRKILKWSTTQAFSNPSKDLLFCFWK